MTSEEERLGLVWGDPRVVASSRGGQDKLTIAVRPSKRKIPLTRPPDNPKQQYKAHHSLTHNIKKAGTFVESWEKYVGPHFKRDRFQGEPRDFLGPGVELPSTLVH